MAESAPRQGILTISIKDKSALYAAYMPFVINGGLFIPTNRDYEMGIVVNLLSPDYITSQVLFGKNI
jgi:type IV pilus assembly protein PilZ